MLDTLSEQTKLIIFFCVLGLDLIVFVLLLISNWKILTKAGKGGYQAIIPIWNNIARYGITGSRIHGFFVTFFFPLILTCLAHWISVMPIWLIIILGVVELAVIICHIAEKFRLSFAFGHGVWFGLGLVFFEAIFLPIMAFGKSQYIGRE